MSGPIGAVLAAGTIAVQAWVQHVNRAGGLNGHQVQYLVFDDGGDPARHKAQVKEAIERKGVIAFVYNPEGVTGAASVEYITEKRVPVIGSDGGGPWFYQSPMYFPQKSHGEAFFPLGTFGASQVLLPDKDKLATVACVEIQSCTDADRIWGETAPKVGFNLVYRGRASVTQPDYSAECLSAARAGAQAILIAMDSTAVSRFALSCARQNYRPTFASMGAIAVDRFKDDPNLDGFYAASDVFPYFQTGTPASDEYQAVTKAAGKVQPGVGTAIGWVAAKIFERIAPSIPEPPTAAGVLHGLWSLKDDTLGGLAMPLTFRENQPTEPKTCWFNMQIKKGTWATTDGYQLHCR